MKRRIRVLIVDDSAMVRKALENALAHDSDIEVVGTAPDPFVARDKILALEPDVLTLDIEMPRMDGVTFLRKLMQYRPMPVIVISSLGHASCQAGLEAFRAGAVEILAKPSGPYSVGELANTLPAKVRAAAMARVRPLIEPGRAGVISTCNGQDKAQPVASMIPVAGSAISFPSSARRCILAIGASTGGPQAISELLQEMPADSPAIVITQHMPPIFTEHLASRLNKLCRIAVKEAKDGDEVIPGRALIAPGDLHMTLMRKEGKYRVRVADGPPVCFSRPSVDVLFHSVAETAGKQAVGILLTGMGADGARGLLRMRECGSYTIAQDEESCIVFGMPKEAIRLGAVASVLPLNRIASSLVRILQDGFRHTATGSQRINQ